MIIKGFSARLFTPLIKLISGIAEALLLDTSSYPKRVLFTSAMEIKIIRIAASKKSRSRLEILVARVFGMRNHGNRRERNQEKGAPAHRWYPIFACRLVGFREDVGDVENQRKIRVMIDSREKETRPIRQFNAN